MFSSFNNIFSFIIKATVIFMGLVITAFSLLLPYLLFDNLLFYIIAFFLGVIISIVVGSYLFVILSIPLQLPQKFDIIKNRVALNKFSSIQEFQSEIGDFMVSFFNFMGVDIIGGKFHFINCDPTIIECGVDFSKLKTQDFIKNRKKLDSGLQAFYLPIQIEDQDLGYMILITKGYTLPLFYSILEDFENYYLDDQIIHFTK